MRTGAHPAAVGAHDHSGAGSIQAPGIEQPTGGLDDRSVGPRTTLYDNLFLSSIVLLSCLGYLGGLGLYSDDWAFLSAFYSTDGSYLELIAAIMPMGFETRPVQAIQVAGLYWLFGLQPLGYHAANCAVLAAAVLLFYSSLKMIGLPRLVCLAAPLIFGLLPHYSTDRFWIAAFQANASVMLYFLSFHADLKFVHWSGGRRWLWKALGTTALIGSVLAYEVTATLFLVNMVVLLHVARVRVDGVWVRSRLAPSIAIASNAVMLALTILYKVTTTVRVDLGDGYRFRALRIFTEAAPVHFGEYGLALPWKVIRALRDYPDPRVLAASVLVGLLAGGYLFVTRGTDGSFSRGINWTYVMLAGGILFVAGYGVSLMTWEIGFHTTGANNRTAIGAAIGVACVFVGAIGWICGKLPSERTRWVSFSILIALLAGSSTVLTNTIAGFWVRAAGQQQVLIEGIQRQFPVLPAGSILLLDGICPFQGPAPVFATSWDMNGMLRLTYDEQSLLGDVVKPNTELTAAGVRTMLFDDVINVYPYGESLVVYHAGVGDAFTLTSVEAARDYFENVSIPARATCPPYTDGDGVPIL